MRERPLLGARDHRVRQRHATYPTGIGEAFREAAEDDMADVEAICEAAQRPTMRFVQGKSTEAPAAAVVFRTRDLLVRQCTQLINALRGHLS
jgi:transposase